MSRILFIDLEVENHKYFGAMASPRHPDNYVVAVGQALDEQPFDGAITGEYYTARPEKWLHIPDDVWLLVAHTAQFEMDWFLVQQRPEIIKFLARGGRIFCTAYAEYLLSNQQETYPSLDATAPKYGGTHKVDGVKILWEQGVLTSEIDKDLLCEYLLGPEGDIQNTRLTFYGQYQQLVARGMWDMALCRMEGMVYNCFAMDAGLYVDRDIAFSQLAEQNSKLAELVALFEQYRGHLPSYVEFKDSSDYHMSAWLFGGPIKYRIKDTWFNDDGTPKYEKVECMTFGEQPMMVPEEGLSAEQFENAVKMFGAVQRYSSGKNKGQPKTTKVETQTPKQKWYDRTFQCQPLIDLSVLPLDIQKEFKKEFTGKRKLVDETPVYSTGSDCIEMLSKRQEFGGEIRDMLQKLLAYAKIDKDVGTYYLREDKDEEGNVVKQSGMLQYLTPQSIVYHVLNCTATVTTRLSSNRPNMQNIPRGDTSDVKKMFTSRFDSPVWLEYALNNDLIDPMLFQECIENIAACVPNGKVVEADYSALEVVCLAAFSKDKNLTRALLDNIDMHCMRLSQQLKEPYEDVLRKCKDESEPEHKRYKTMRTDIKPKAFAYQYGATAAGIAFATGCTVEDAQAFIDAEKSLFPDVERYYEDVIFAAVEKNTTMHREQTESGGWRVYKRGTWSAVAGTTFEFRQYPKTRWVDGQKIDLMEFKPTQMRNYPIQGESGFFVQGIAGLVMRWLISVGFFGNRVWIINQVHDALYLDCHVSVLKEVARTLKAIMESLPQYFNQNFGYDLGVPFPAAVEAGPSMYEKHEVVIE